MYQYLCNVAVYVSICINVFWRDGHDQSLLEPPKLVWEALVLTRAE